MATDVIIPKLGFSVDEMTLIEWLATDGSEISTGDALFVVESDKATQEIESPASGLLKIRAETGESYKVGTVIATIE